MTIYRKATAEFIGTFWLVFGGCGSAVLAAAFRALGSASGSVAGVRPHGPDHGVCDRPRFGMPLESRRLGRIGCGQAISCSELPAYVIAQVLGGIAGSAVLYAIASGNAIQLGGRVCLQRLRGPFARRICLIRPDRRSGADVHVPDDHSGSHRHSAPRRVSRRSQSA